MKVEIDFSRIVKRVKGFDWWGIVACSVLGCAFLPLALFLLKILTNLIVIVLDAPWAEGKDFFPNP